MILCERPSEGAPHALSIQADFRALGDRLLDPDQQQKRLKAPRTQELEKTLLEYQEKGTEVNACTAELYSSQGHIDLTVLMVIDEITLCKVCKEHIAKESHIAHVSNSAGIFSPRDNTLIFKHITCFQLHGASKLFQNLLLRCHFRLIVVRLRRNRLTVVQKSMCLSYTCSGSSSISRLTAQLHSHNFHLHLHGDALDE